jgi:DNA-nicking Smr family endonuclease
MQKYATLGQLNIGADVALTQVTLQAHQRRNDTRTRRCGSQRFLGDSGQVRVHNGRMKGKSTGQRVKRPAVAPEEQALFLEAVAGVKPLNARDRVPVPPAPPSVVKVVELPPEVKLAVEGDSQRYAARGPGVSHAQIAELRGGKVRAEATLDLHGHTVAPALQQLRQFMIESRRLSRRCVLVVHGKGTHSEHGAPLREAVLGELLGPLSGFVHALASASPNDGGEGATCVMLRGSR